MAVQMLKMTMQCVDQQPIMQTVIDQWLQPIKDHDAAPDKPHKRRIILIHDSDDEPEGGAKPVAPAATVSHERTKIGLQLRGPEHHHLEILANTNIPDGMKEPATLPMLPNTLGEDNPDDLPALLSDSEDSDGPISRGARRMAMATHARALARATSTAAVTSEHQALDTRHPTATAAPPAPLSLATSPATSPQVPSPCPALISDSDDCDDISVQVQEQAAPPPTIDPLNLWKAVPRQSSQYLDLSAKHGSDDDDRDSYFDSDSSPLTDGFVSDHDDAVDATDLEIMEKEFPITFRNLTRARRCRKYREEPAEGKVHVTNADN
jgi:hypothetical protein